MNAPTKIKPTCEGMVPTATSIVALVEASPAMVLTDRAKFDELFAVMRAEVDAHTPDLANKRGRDAIKSLAFKVTRTKTAIDDAGKAMNEEARKCINAVDAERRMIREKLDALRDEVRKPLADWETREANAEADLAAIRDMARMDMDATAEAVAERIEALSAMVVDPAIHLTGTDHAREVLKGAINALREAHTRLIREEADRAELAALRAKDAEREAEAEAKRAADEAAANAEVARALELARVAKAQEEAAAAAVEAERKRVAKVEADKQAEAARLAAEDAARQRNTAHRSKVMGEAKAALMKCGLDEAMAKAVVISINKGMVPHVSIAF